MTKITFVPTTETTRLNLHRSVMGYSFIDYASLPKSRIEQTLPLNQLTKDGYDITGSIDIINLAINRITDHLVSFKINPIFTLLDISRTVINGIDVLIIWCPFNIDTSIYIPNIEKTIETPSYKVDMVLTPPVEPEIDQLIMEAEPDKKSRGRPKKV